MNSHVVKRAGSALVTVFSCSSSSSACSRAAPRRLFAPSSIASPPSRPFTSVQSRRQEIPSSSSSSDKTAQVASDLSPASDSEPQRSLTDALSDPPPILNENEQQVDWTRSFHGLSTEPFTAEQSEILQRPLESNDIEIKPDGLAYLPEIKYRRVLNRAFGPGGWGLAPRGETIVTGKTVTREYGLVCQGRLVSIARGEQQYFDPEGIPTATEGCKSNALMRCCKDLGIASELWDPRFIKTFLADFGKEVIVEHVLTKKRRRHWMRKDDEIKYPFKEAPAYGAPAPAAQSSSTSTTSSGSVTQQAGAVAKKAYGSAAAAAKPASKVAPKVSTADAAEKK